MPGDGDTKIPFPIVLTHVAAEGWYKTFPTGYLPTLLIFILFFVLLGSCLVTVFILPLLFFFFCDHKLMQGEKTTAEKPRAWPMLHNLSWDEKQQKPKPKNKTKPTKQVRRERKSDYDSWVCCNLLRSGYPGTIQSGNAVVLYFFLNSYTSMILLHCS